MSDRELTIRVFECLERAGFSGELDLDNPGGPQFGFQLDPDREEIFFAERDACYEDLRDAGLAADPNVAPSESELESRYVELLLSNACLAENGVDVDPAPSLRSYIDNGGRWLPWDAIPLESTTEERLNELLLACPQ